MKIEEFGLQPSREMRIAAAAETARRHLEGIRRAEWFKERPMAAFGLCAASLEAAALHRSDVFIEAVGAPQSMERHITVAIDPGTDKTVSRNFTVPHLYDHHLPIGEFFDTQTPEEALRIQELYAAGNLVCNVANGAVVAIEEFYQPL